MWKAIEHTSTFESKSEDLWEQYLGVHVAASCMPDTVGQLGYFEGVL
jgi:hypothetical protein